MNETTDISRNDNGLVKNVHYHYKANGRVDWRKMISPEYIVPNRERTTETDISKIPDNHLLILLAGFRQVAALRGFRAVEVSVPYASESLVLSLTKITWIGNYETGMQEEVYTGAADAHPRNTKEFGTNFLTAISANRSFIRAVREYLEIPILGSDELGGDSGVTSEDKKQNPHSILTEILEKNNIGTERFLTKMVKLKVAGAENWSTISDVPVDRILEIKGIVEDELQKAIAAKAAKAAKK